MKDYKKCFTFGGMIVSAVVFLVGIVILFTGLGVNTYSVSAQYGYDQGYATFGADFYNYVANNTAHGAEGSTATAANLSELIYFVKNISGILFMAIGALSFCFFGLYFGKNDQSKVDLKAHKNEIITEVDEKIDVNQTKVESVSDFDDFI